MREEKRDALPLRADKCVCTEKMFDKDVKDFVFDILFA